MQEKQKILIKYVPHGINSESFYKIGEDETYRAFKETIFNGKDIKYVVFWNSRNIQRKGPANIMVAYRIFCDRIGKEASSKCALVMHTDPVDSNGTDLYAVRDAFCDDSYINVYFSTDHLNTPQMNYLYNLADVSLLTSSNEGWGLSLTESMMSETMIIATVTGGMQDQMRFEKDGKWIDFNSDFPSNHRGTVKDCGEWAIPVFPSNLHIVGSIPTPYISDDRASAEDIATAIGEVYKMSTEERERRGKAGREWVLSEESGMSAKGMCNNVINAMDTVLENFIPRPKYNIYKAKEVPKKYITHKITDY